MCSWGRSVFLPHTYIIPQVGEEFQILGLEFWVGFGILFCEENVPGGRGTRFVCACLPENNPAREKQSRGGGGGGGAKISPT